MLILPRRKLLSAGAAALAYNQLLEAEARAQSSPCGISTGIPLPIPPAALAAGMTQVVFEDDFTTNDTFATTANQNYGGNVKWFFGFAGDNPGHSVNTTQTAAQLAGSLNLPIVNGGVSTGGGPKPSPNGGIVSLREVINPTYDSWITVPGNYLASLGNNSALPPVGQGNWQHFYAENYILFNVNTAAVGSGPGVGYSWPSFWTGSAERMGFDFGNGLKTTNDWIEWDIMESFGHQNFSNSDGVCRSGIIHWHDPGNGGNSTQPASDQIFIGYPRHNSNGIPDPNGSIAASPPYFDNNWHVIGGLWQVDPNNAGQGLVSFYFDDVQVGTTISTGGVGSRYPMEVLHQFLIMPGPGGTPVFSDYVRVFQKPGS